jgi:SAM-dependent methyltransferase
VTTRAHVEASYRRRASDDTKYSPLRKLTLETSHERRRALVRTLNRNLRTPLDQARILDIGSGDGGVLLELLLLGASPENLVGNELLPHRIKRARLRLPNAVELVEGDITTQELPASSFDVGIIFLVLMTVPRGPSREHILHSAMRLLKPDALLLVLEPIVPNPRNRDVARVREGELIRSIGIEPVDTSRLHCPPPFNRISASTSLLYSAASTVLWPIKTHRLWTFQLGANSQGDA